MSAAAEVGFDLALNKHLLPWPAQAEYHSMQLPNNAADSVNQQHDVTPRW